VSDSPFPDLSALLSQLSQLRSQTVEGRSGGGLVKITATGDMRFEKVTIDPSVVESGEAEVLEDLVLAALRDTVEQVRALTAGSIDLGGLLNP
jgi:DNA-binding YbaB/EbfC family protein